MKTTERLDRRAVAETQRFLQARREELAQAVRALVSQRRGRQVERAADEAAWAAETLHDEIQVALMDRYHQQMRLIDAALERLAEGEYGRCQDCSRFIGLPRLRALPFAQRCSTCQSRDERRGRRTEPLIPLEAAV